MSIPVDPAAVWYLQHSGERSLRQALGVPSELSDGMGYWPSDFMPQQHTDFFCGLTYFAAGSLDSTQRPWASVLLADRADGSTVGPVSALSPRQLCIDVTGDEHAAWTPWREHMMQVLQNKGSRERLLFAGLGMDVTNRRRNKVGGVIQPWNVQLQRGRLTVIADTEESMGNCPKYITVRPHIHVVHQQPGATHKHVSPESKEKTTDCSSALVPPLNDDARAVIAQASTVWMATRHQANPSAGPGSAFNSMDVNHRGGNPGFVRVSRDGFTVYLPDYSGNRIYSSLGNIVSDGVAGLTLPNFETGDILYLTGDAQVLLGEESTKIMPRQKLLVRLQITAWVLVRGGLNLRSPGEAHLSPYNPPVRPLAEEAKLAITSHSDAGSTSVHLLGGLSLTDDMAVFTFQSSSPLHYTPGQYVVLDFSQDDGVPQGYRHMNEHDPRSLNDDFVRTWTISSAPARFKATVGQQESAGFDTASTFSCTIKRVGRISTLLHGYLVLKSFKSPVIRVVGLAGDFTCFDASTGATKYDHMLWAAAGSGITPFVSMWTALKQQQEEDAAAAAAGADGGFKTPAVTLVYSSRSEDELTWAQSTFAGVAQLQLFHTGKDAAGTAPSAVGPHTQVHRHHRRVTETDLTALSANVLAQAQGQDSVGAFVCGPAAFSEGVLAWLHAGTFPKNAIHHESFKF